VEIGIPVDQIESINMNCKNFHSLLLGVSSRPCPDNRYLAAELAVLLDFTLQYYLKDLSLDKMYIEIIDATRSDIVASLDETTWSFLLLSYSMWSLYCLNTPLRSTTYTFSAWWVPFQEEIWILIASVVITSTLVIVFSSG